MLASPHACTATLATSTDLATSSLYLGRGRWNSPRWETCVGLAPRTPLHWHTRGLQEERDADAQGHVQRTGIDSNGPNDWLAGSPARRPLSEMAFPRCTPPGRPLPQRQLCRQ